MSRNEEMNASLRDESHTYSSNVPSDATGVAIVGDDAAGAARAVGVGSGRAEAALAKTTEALMVTVQQHDQMRIYVRPHTQRNERAAWGVPAGLS